MGQLVFALVGVSGMKNKDYVWLYTITITLLCGTILALFTWIVSFLPIFVHISFWVILLSSYIYTAGLAIANDVFSIKIRVWLSILFIFFYGILFTYLGIKASPFFLILDMFLVTVTTFLVQLGYHHFKRGANGKTKDN